MRRALVPAGVLAAIATAAVAPAAAAGQTITVNSTGDWPATPADVTDCLQGTNTCTLRAAVFAAEQDADGDVIQFAPSVTGTIALKNGTITVTSDLTIQGPGATTLAIDGSAGVGGGIIQQIQGTLSISGLTLQNGLASPESDDQTRGGGIVQLGGALNVSNVTFSGNVSNNGTNGGAIFASGTSTSVTDSTFTANHASGGSGGQDGGAIYLDAGTLTVQGSTFSGNVATGSGGAIAADAGTTVEVSGSTFTSNQAANGGGIEVLSGDLGVSSSTFSSNSATGRGAAIDMQAPTGTATISGSYLTGNTGGTPGGAVTIQDVLVMSGTFVEHNSGSAVGGVSANSGYLTATTISWNQAAPFSDCTWNAGCAAGLHLVNGELTDVTIAGNSSGGPIPALQCVFGGIVRNGGGNNVPPDCNLW